MEVRTLVSWDTVLSADSVEWCPAEGLQHVFVCGTYQLTEPSTPETDTQPREPYEETTEPVKTPSTRLGKLYLLAFDNSNQVIKQLQCLDTAAILDCKWAPELVTMLAVATALGQVCVYSLATEKELSTQRLIEEATFTLQNKSEEEELLALSLDWSVTRDNIKIAASDSQGCITVLQLDETGLHTRHNWTAHNFEAWIVHLDPFNPSTCYTGGDDSKLRIYDLRSDLNFAQITSSAHSAGVTSLSCAKKEAHTLLSGSYDEQVLLWDKRQLKRFVSSVNVGGGVWRLRWQPRSEALILAACMYNGFHILDRDLQVVADYSEHKSIAYGADWSHLESDTGAVVATCSFYDHKLCVSVVK